MLSISASNQFIPMGKTRNTRSVKASEQGHQELIKAKAAKRNYEGRTWTDLDIATAAGVSDKTVQRFFDGIGVDKASAIAIVQALGLEITKVIDPNELNLPVQTCDEIDWREVCGKVLAQQRENQRLRRQATERGFELKVYVPLGLVERKQQQRRRGDVPLEQVYQLTEEVITKEYDNDKFLTEVIEPGKSKRIAIIGEPGAGKTTLQEKIAVWIHENNQGLPICIPLGGLQGKSLEDYLLQIWLKAALRFIEPDASGVEAKAFASLQKQFREGKVWLLLDGVDEMAATSPVEALATIKEQLTDWLVEARVVLTCRLNIWDANVKNMLTGFETYRTLEFKPEQVEDFIRQWFACASESQRGEELLRKLQETGRERIRELVRNPLRLSLLCQTSYLLPVDEPLPETKAALYERFTRYFYEWKQEQHPTTRTERRQLNQALGELAKTGINSTVRFRLGENLACNVMGEPLFDLACRLGWLNLVDREAKTDEAVYAFFHPTFQEYCAACAIDDWHFFLNHVPDNPMQGTYRIFEPQWKELVLLWLGRECVKSTQKEQFIQTLVELKDECNGFYAYQAYFIAVAGISEFARCSRADEVVAQIVQWSFGYFNIEKQDWETFIEPIAEGARAVLLEIDKARAIKSITGIIRTIKDKDSLDKALQILLNIDPDNSDSINVMIELIPTVFEEDTEINLFIRTTMERVLVGNSEAILVLSNLLDATQSEDEWKLMQVAELLKEIDPGNTEAISALTDLLYTSQDWNLIECVEGLLEGINRTNSDIISNFEEFFSWLKSLEKGDQAAIEYLENRLRLNNDSNLICGVVVRTLGEIDPGNIMVIDTCIERLCDNTYLMPPALGNNVVVEDLAKVGFGNRYVIDKLTEVLLTNQDEEVLRRASKCLGKINPGNLLVIEFITKLLHKHLTYQKSDDDKLSLNYLNALEFADSLWKIDPENLNAIHSVMHLLQNSKNKLVLERSVKCLRENLQDKHLAGFVTSLKDYLSDESYVNDFELFDACYKVLWYCAENMPYPDFYQAWHQTTNHENR